jgi:type 2 lantibiotic biosynthesis protein LanM
MNDSVTNKKENEHFSAWCNGLSLPERLEAINFKSAQNQNINEQSWLHTEWESLPAFSKNPSLLKARLKKLNLNVQEFGILLNKKTVLDPTKLSLKWAETIDKLYNSPSDVKLTERIFKDYPKLKNVEFLKFSLPIIFNGIVILEQKLKSLEIEHAHVFDLNTLINSFLDNLLNQIARLTSRTLVLEMHNAKLTGLLKETTSESRFKEYLTLLSDKKFAFNLLLQYPVLARRLVLISDNWIDSTLEFSYRLVKDYSQIERTFTKNSRLGKFNGLGTHGGDNHRRGRSVFIVKFSSGKQVVYKPRSVSIEANFQKLLSWFNANSNKTNFKITKTLNLKHHGWVEFIDFKPCTNDQQLTNFYYQLGCLKAVLYALKATDFHYENFIAYVDQPIAIDLETLFNTGLSGSSNMNPYYSVLTIGMLPTKISDKVIDVSGMGADTKSMVLSDSWVNSQSDTITLGKAKRNLNKIQSNPGGITRSVSASNYIDDISAGFSHIYKLISKNIKVNTSLSALFNNFAGDKTRFVFKSTQDYMDLLWESYHPSYLKCGLLTSKLFDNLWNETDHNQAAISCIDDEISDLFNCDIPIFEGHINATSVLNSKGAETKQTLQKSPLEMVKDHLNNFSNNNLKVQLWLIKSSLNIKNKTHNNAVFKSNTLNHDLCAMNNSNDLLLAEQVGDFLIEISQQTNKSAMWNGQFYSGTECNFDHIGPTLYDGQLGVIWFLAYLSKVTNQNKYKTIANKGLNFYFTNHFKRQLNDTSIGLFSGIGAIVYVISHVKKILPNHDYEAYLNQIFDVLPNKIKEDQQLDIIAGTAGCLIALESLYKSNPSDELLTLCRLCGDKLVSQAHHIDQGISWKIKNQEFALAGLSHGASGISTALSRLSNLLDDDKYLKVAEQGIQFESSLLSKKYNNWLDLRIKDKEKRQCGWAWCHGAPGIALTRLELSQNNMLHNSNDLLDELELAVASTVSNSWPSDYSLCHGSFGNLDILSFIAEKTHNMQLKKDCSMSLFSAIQLWSSPHKTFKDFLRKTPALGLMTGTTGIGYSLLRHYVPEVVPNILAMQSPK